MTLSSGADAPNCFPSRMTMPEPNLRTDVRAMLRSVGINVTEEGIARARRRRIDAQAKWTPEARAALRKQLGLREKEE
jgi:hypothetical protein